MNTNTDKETPDYGEPWAIDPTDGFWNKVVSAEGKCVSGLGPTRRAIQCVNACVGMADPAAELAELRRERDELHRRLEEECRSADDLIKQRDAAEEFINEMFFAATGEEPEWTNAYGYQEALEAVREQTLGWQESGTIMAGKVNEQSEKIASLTAERDEARAELAAMREAIKAAHVALQGRVNSEGCSCEEEWSSPHIRARHSAACNATKAALAKLKPFIK